MTLQEPASFLLVVEAQLPAADRMADYRGVVAVALGLPAIEQTGHEAHPGTPQQGHASTIGHASAPTPTFS